MSGSAAVARPLQTPYLGPEPLPGHHLRLLLQQGITELLCPPRRRLFLLLLLVRFPGLQLALGNLGTKRESAGDKASGRALPLSGGKARGPALAGAPEDGNSDGECR